MFSNDLFSLGLAGPIALLCLGVPAVELLFAGIVIVVRSRMAPKCYQVKRIRTPYGPSESL